MRYFFMAEPIRAMEGDLLGVEITTHFASSPARPLHPEFVISSWDNSQKRRFLLDLLRTIAAKHGWFLRHGLFCIVNIDRGMAQLVLQDKDIRALLHAMLFVELQVAEHFSCQDNALIDPLIHALHKQPNPLWLGAKWHLNRSQFGIRIDHDLASISDHSLASQSITIWHASDH